jgi:hypothetical protein
MMGDGYTMPGWAGSTAAKLPGRVYGYGEKRMVGYGPSLNYGPTYGPKTLQIGSIFYPAKRANLRSFTTLPSKHTAEATSPHAGSFDDSKSLKVGVSEVKVTAATRSLVCFAESF